jgi:hypothetical protein
MAKGTGKRGNPINAGYEIRKPEIEQALRELGRTIGSQTPEGYGFALLMFSFEGHEMFYISNAQREDMIKAMLEFVERQVKQDG